MLKFPTILHNIRDLNLLEERMVSLRIPFYNIVPLVHQYGLKGSVVNVPIDVNTSVNILPRHFNHTYTIQIKLKRQIRNARKYIYQTVSPSKILTALHEHFNRAKNWPKMLKRRTFS